MSDAESVVDAVDMPAVDDTQGTPAPELAEAKADDKHDPKWMSDRLGRAKRAEQDRILKELGFGDLDAAKATLAKAKEYEDSQKSELERLTEQLLETKQRASRADAMAKTLAKLAERELSGLAEDEREFIMSVAGDDAQRQLELAAQYRAIAARRASPVAAAPEPKPEPASTSVATKAPPEASSPKQDLRAEYENLQATNPRAAAYFLMKHIKELEAG